MNVRKKSTITIYRGSTEVVTIPITKDCKRVYKLMEEDYVKLSFKSLDAIAFEIDDYIDDEIFGRFYIANKQAGTWEAKEGVYKYEITFVAEYMTWAKYEYMYTEHEIINTGTDSGELIRKESEWYLTAKLSQHLDMIITNLSILGFDYTYEIHAEAEKANEVKYQQNKSQTIIDALNKLAEDYGCEWWVDRNVIHFGKCEHGDEIEIIPQQHLSNYSVKDNRNDYCNVVRAYGGDKNIPMSYRKELYLKIDQEFTIYEYGVGTTYWADSSKKLTPEMFRSGYEMFYSAVGGAYFPSQFTAKKQQYKNIATLWHDALPETATYNVTFAVYDIGVAVFPFCIKNFQGGTREYYGVLDVYLEYEDGTSLLLNTWRTQKYNIDSDITESYDVNFEFENWGALPSVTIEKKILEQGKRFRIVSYVRCDIPLAKEETLECKKEQANCPSTTIEFNPAVTLEDGERFLSVVYYEGERNHHALIKIKGVAYLNPTTNESSYYGLTCDTDGVLKIGRVLLVETGNNINIPQAYYLDTLDDPSSIARLGSKRLRLPIHDSDGTLTNGVLMKKQDVEYIDFDGFDKYIYITTLTNVDGNIVYDAKTGEVDDIEWDSEDRPVGVVGDTSIPIYSYGYKVLTGLLAGDEIVFGNTIATGIVNMRRWIAIDSKGLVMDYSRDNNSDEEKNYVVREGCKRIICTHYNEDIPENIPYIQIRRMMPIRERVEKTVIFDDVYPKMLLYVKDVATTKRTDKETIESEEDSKVWNWLEYTITLQITLDGEKYTDFKFSDDYIIEGSALQIQFLYDGALDGLEGAKTSKLAGMIFDVKHVNDGTTSKFKIIRNEDFGAKLPSDILCPETLDPCTLIGWNIKAVTSTGIIEAAENKLLRLAKEYKNALEDNPYTFECTLFADFAIENTSIVYFADKNDNIIVCKDGDYLVVDNHILLTQGQRIRIIDDTLHNGYCSSRLIGFEYNLDIPWDSPKLTIGDTDAYSRLASIEKEIKKS